MVNDSSLEALRAARKNAQWAGVAAHIEFNHGDFSKIRMPEPPGVVMINPEYGTRLGEVKQLAETYSRIGDFFKSRMSGVLGLHFFRKPGSDQKDRAPVHP